MLGKRRFLPGQVFLKMWVGDKSNSASHEPLLKEVRLQSEIKMLIQANVRLHNTLRNYSDFSQKQGYVQNKVKYYLNKLLH